jgi:Transcriptional repressor TCF25
MRGTWRTAYEWAKLLLSLDTDDPYSIVLLIDHLALRGREYEHFIDLCTQTVFSKQWKRFPNIHCSLVLAYFRLNQLQKAREQLKVAMSEYRWIFCRLAQELDIQPVPRSIWGKMPPTEPHALLSELYIARVKDLWNTPEVTALLVEISNSLPEDEPLIGPPEAFLEVTLNIARHVVLSDIPKVIAHLPPHFTSGRISASDPLPPYNSEAFHRQSASADAPRSRIPGQWLHDQLDQFHNGDLDVGLIHFRNHGEEEWDEEDEEDDDSDNEHSLEASLLGDRLHILLEFFREHGVDRGNWDNLSDSMLLTDYACDLNNVQPRQARLSLLHGPIEEIIGPMATAILEDEMNMLDEEDTGMH